jgi:FkbM family methyltransferase|tara:strand:- start:1258 stop:1899 length:642 start_codon:yes stop_codon:yes gene_type:complete
MKIEKLSGGLWVPSMDAQIDEWREKGNPFMQETGLNQFVQWCDNQHKKFNLIVDVGAWCGTWTLSMQQYAKNIHCYEPNKLHYECLSRNLSTHSHVNLYNQAVGNEDGFVKLTEESATQNTRVLLEKGETKINKLDSLDTAGIDMIKIDVEGLEMEVLKGAGKTLENVEYLMIELNGNSEKYGSSKRDIKEHLKSLGFKVLMKTWPDIVYYKA